MMLPRSIKYALTTSARYTSSVAPLTKQQKEKLRVGLPNLNVRRDVEPAVVDLKASDDSRSFMDEIRARGMLRVRKDYKPAENVAVRIAAIAEELSITPEGPFRDLEEKSQFLNMIVSEFNHSVPNSKLHTINSIEDVVGFYQTPASNITEYARLARDEELPANLSVREAPVRFHPNDHTATHRGVTAFPGSGGKVISTRNRRIYREFRPKKAWFDYEEQRFDHEAVDRDMPWDPKIASQMDRYIDRKFQKNSFKKL